MVIPGLGALKKTCRKICDQTTRVGSTENRSRERLLKGQGDAGQREIHVSGCPSPRLEPAKEQTRQPKGLVMSSKVLGDNGGRHFRTRVRSVGNGS